MVREGLYDLYSPGVDALDPGPNPALNPELVAVTRRQRNEEQQHPTRMNYRPARGSSRPRPRRAPPRFAVVEQLDNNALLPAIVFVFSRAGCEDAVDQVFTSGLRLTNHDERELIREIVERTLRGHADGGPWRARLHELARAPRGGPRRTPRGSHPAVQRGGRGALSARPHQGGLCHRDPCARHQHARAFGGAREARQVGRQAASRPHGRGVHAAHGARGQARHRHRGPRGGRRAPRVRRWPAWPPRVAPHVPPDQFLPTVVQHDHQPGVATMGEAARARGARALVRPVPGGSVGGGQGEARPRTRRRGHGLSRGRRVRQGRFHGVRGACESALLASSRRTRRGPPARPDARLQRPLSPPCAGETWCAWAAAGARALPLSWNQTTTPRRRAQRS